MTAFMRRNRISCLFCCLTTETEKYANNSAALEHSTGAHSEEEGTEHVIVVCSKIFFYTFTSKFQASVTRAALARIVLHKDSEARAQTRCCCMHIALCPAPAR